MDTNGPDSLEQRVELLEDRVKALEEKLTSAEYLSFLADKISRRQERY